MSIRRIRVIGSGIALPSQETTCKDLDAKLGLAPGTSYQQTGIRRRYLSTEETAAELAARACCAALADAGLDWSDIDCLVGTSATMDQALPYNAALIHAELNLCKRRTATFDVGASCLSFLAGLDIVSYLVECGRYHNVMFVSSDIATFGMDWTNLKEGAIFGDGAAAIVIRRSFEYESSSILSSKMETLSAGVEFCQIPAGGSRFHPRRMQIPIDPLSTLQMNGKAMFKLISEEMQRFVSELLLSADLTLDQISKIVPHQASQLALDHMIRRLQVPPEKVVDIFKDFGNQVGASLPTALHTCLSGKQLHRGESLLLIGTGAGLTMGGMVLVY
ncbi:MAG: 3-oxoacyl-ACP synthase [Burkholderiaceae bacterium]|nr:3-oxoacyl-ACP synthase [Burkholderiaceae bacterium]